MAFMGKFKLAANFSKILISFAETFGNCDLKGWLSMFFGIVSYNITHLIGQNRSLNYAQLLANF